MRNPIPQKLRNDVRAFAPSVISGIVLGVAGSALVVRRMYHPNDKVAIQMPKGVFEMMRDEGKGLAISSQVGWFTLNYHPQD